MCSFAPTYSIRNLLGSENASLSMHLVEHQIGNRVYELSNHLGNVLTTISDKPLPYDDDADDETDWFLADIRTAQDYSPFGVTLSGRNFSVSEGYRYGFQGQEMDDEVKGKGNSVNYSFRMHDPRIGRFFATDPLKAKYPYYTPYQFSGNKLIAFRELEGLEEIGATKDGNPVHEPGYNINIPGANGSTDVTKFQRGEGGSLAITQSGLDNLVKAGYKAEQIPNSYYDSPSMSTDPAKQMRVSLGGTTVTSDHSGSNYDKQHPNKFSMWLITPPKEVQVGVRTQQIVSRGQEPIMTSGVNSADANGALFNEAVTTMSQSVTTQLNILTNDAPAGTTRVINSTTVLVNANLYSTAQMTQMQNSLNPSGQLYQVNVVPITNLPASTYFTGGTASYTDTRNIVIPIMVPTSTNVTIKDLVKPK